jgi:uncharacterized protein
MTPIPVTLATAATCAILNNWLGMRIAAFRKEFRVSVGDGGHDPLLRRMRAQANFIEHAPFVLILLLGLEISGANRIVLAVLAALFVVARILHGLGMDGGERQRFRMYGMMSSSLVTLILIVWALACAVGFCLGR